MSVVCTRRSCCQEMVGVHVATLLQGTDIEVDSMLEEVQRWWRNMQGRKRTRLLPESIAGEEEGQEAHDAGSVWWICWRRQGTPDKHTPIWAKGCALLLLLLLSTSAAMSLRVHEGGAHGFVSMAEKVRAKAAAARRGGTRMAEARAAAGVPDRLLVAYLISCAVTHPVSCVCACVVVR